jgi:nucleobase transporter 1/2
MLGSTVLIPSIVVPPMGATDKDLAAVICTIFFASGIVTLLQTLLGDRLPIVQGGSFAYISPTLGEPPCSDAKAAAVCAL